MTLYEKAYFDARVNDSQRALMMLQERERILHLTGNKPGTMLDIGCGQGEFLAMFPDWIRYGTEVSEYAAEVAYRRRGVCFDLPDRDGWADVAVIRGVLQHLPAPVTELERARAALKAGGLLAVLATPNAGGPVYRLFQDLPCLDPARNFTVFSAKTLRHVLTNLGFRDATAIYPYHSTPYAQPVRDFARLLTGRMPAAFPGSMMEMYARKP